MSLTKIRYTTTELRVTCAPDRATGRSHRCQLSIRTAGLRFEVLSFEIKLRHFKTGTTRDVLTSQDVWSLWTRNTVAFSNRDLDSFGICPLVNPLKFFTFWFWLLRWSCANTAGDYPMLTENYTADYMEDAAHVETMVKGYSKPAVFPWESKYGFLCSLLLKLMWANLDRLWR